MILHQYIIDFAKPIFLVIAVIIGFYSFGNPDSFSALMIAILAISMFIYRKDIDILSCLALMLICNIILVLFFKIEELNFVIKLFIYILTVVTLYYSKDDAYLVPIIIVITSCILAEAFWLIKGITPPEIEWYIAVLLVNLIIRNLIFLRPFLISKHLKVKSNSTDLDLSIYTASGFFILIELANLIEYLVRKIWIDDLLYLYNIYPYLVHAASIYLLWVTLNFGFTTYQNRAMEA